MKIVGLYRETRFSNRAVRADRAIMDKAMSQIMTRLKLSRPLEILQAEDGMDLSPLAGCDCILSMAQGPEILTQLQELERGGIRVFNSVTAIQNCYRRRLSELLGDGNFFYPQYLVLPTSGPVPSNLPFLGGFRGGFWVKRGDFHAIQDNDVQFVENIEDLRREMADYAARGITHVICQENITGHIIKFYGVTDSFFSHRYMGMTGPDRYNLPGGQMPDDLDMDHIRENAFEAARKLGLVIYGGDCIVDAKGGLHYIDVNDWPSFRTCADDAAYAISEYVIHSLNIRSIAL